MISCPGDEQRHEGEVDDAGLQRPHRGVLPLRTLGAGLASDFPVPTNDSAQPRSTTSDAGWSKHTGSGDCIRSPGPWEGP